MQPLDATAYLAPEDHVDELAHELGDVRERYERLLLAPGPPRPVAWVRNVWHGPVRVAIESIGDAGARLRAIQRNWAGYSFTQHRRAQLIQDKLPHVAAAPLTFPCPPPSAPLGSWTLLDRDTLLCAARCSSPFPNGELRFVEDRTGPPSRAYLKLWDALTTIGARPAAGQRCLDLGSAPGGWTWVLQGLGAEVVSVDKAPLASHVAALPRVEQRRVSAFGLRPDEVGRIDWLFSDVVCYPERLLRLVRTWLAADARTNVVCTIKFQGTTDHDVARAFAAIEGGRLLHLTHNKHELTFVRLAPSAGR